MALLGIVLIFTLSIGIGAIGARVMLEAVFLLMMRSAVQRTAGETVRFKGADFALHASAV